MDIQVGGRVTARARWALAAAALVVTCAPNLSPQSLVDRFRVLALRASPASGAPGEEVTLEVLMSDTPSGALPFVLWTACLPLPGQSGRQCLESLATDENASERFVLLGLEPGATFTLPGLAADQESSEVFIVFLACAGLPLIPDCECPGPDCESCLQDLDMFNLCDGDDAIVFKSVRAYADPSEGNRNPGIARVLIDGEEWAADAEPDLPCSPDGPCEKVDLAIEAAPGSAEQYVVIRFGEEVTYTEEPYVSWFATSGSMGKERSSVDDATGLADVRWSPQEDGAGPVKFYFVMYDARGGVDFAERHARVTD
jgi:hypothetical protein